MSLDTTFELSTKEQIRACRVVHMRRYRRAYLLWSVFLALALVGMILRPSTWPPLATLAALSVLGIASLYAMPWRTIRDLRAGDRTAGQPHQFLLHAEGIRTNTLGASSSLEWSNIAEVFENEEFFLFYVSMWRAIILPKRVLDEEQLQELRTSLNAWLPSATRLRLTHDGVEQEDAPNEGCKEGTE